MAKGTFTVTLTVEPEAAAPLAVGSPEDLGPVGEPSLPISGLAITGGVPPYAVAVQDASLLPPGVTINPDGTFSGLPTAAGSYSPVVDVTDSLG